VVGPLGLAVAAGCLSDHCEVYPHHCVDGEADETDDDGVPDPVAGEATYTMSCAVSTCHAVGDPVQLSERVPMLDDAELTDQIRMGNDLMPSFSEAAIDAEQLANLIAFLRAEFG
jgi:hypothetical protein